MNQIQVFKERQTIENAIENLEHSMGISIEWTQNNAHDNGIDGYLKLFDQTFAIEHKSSFNLSVLPTIISLKNKYPNLILITNNITDKLKKILKDNKIQYLDTVGNVYINTGSIFIFSESKNTEPKTILNKDKAFTKKGIAVVFHFLNNELLLNQTYRQICQVTGVSLDTLTKVIQSLRQQGFIQSIDAKNMRLIDKKRLFEKWADAYENKLKPSLFVGNFRFQNIETEKNWQNIQLLKTSVWGGEPAANILTNGFLQPAQFTLYTTETKNELIKNYRFLPDPNGNIKVYFPFIDIQNLPSNLPLWVYADLINSGIARNFEVAQKIYNQYVKDYF